MADLITLKLTTDEASDLAHAARSAIPGQGASPNYQTNVEETCATIEAKVAEKEE